jgi:hypothetical protein
MKKYVQKCRDANQAPFNDSVFKLIVASIFSGFITIIILVLGLIYFLIDSYKEKREKNVLTDEEDEVD